MNIIYYPLQIILETPSKNIESHENLLELRKCKDVCNETKSYYFHGKRRLTAYQVEFEMDHVFQVIFSQFN